MKGIWQLVIRGSRSDRFGMLHSWGLTVTPEETDIRDAVLVVEAVEEPKDGSSADPKLKSKSKPKPTATVKPAGKATAEGFRLGRFLDAFK